MGCRGKYFEPKRAEVTAHWLILQGEELHGILLTKHHAGYQIKELDGLGMWHVWLKEENMQSFGRKHEGEI
jgi:hypothetical protein